MNNKAVKNIMEIKAPDAAIYGNAAEIDTGIREAIREIRFSILAMGIGLAHIKANSLFIDLECQSMAQYVERLSN